MSCRVNPHVATTATWRLINTLHVKNISVQIESSNLLTLYPSVNSKMIWRCVHVWPGDIWVMKRGCGLVNRNSM